MFIVDGWVVPCLFAGLPFAYMFNRERLNTGVSVAISCCTEQFVYIPRKHRRCIEELGSPVERPEQVMNFLSTQDWVFSRP